MEKGESWILDINSKALEQLLNFENIDIHQHSDESFCGKLLNANDIKTSFEMMQRFSKCIKAERTCSNDPEEETSSRINVFEVDVDFRNGNLVVEERVCVIF